VYPPRSQPPVCHSASRPILGSDGPPGVAALSGPQVPLLGVWREHGGLRHQRARPARKPCLGAGHLLIVQR